MRRCFWLICCRSLENFKCILLLSRLFQNRYGELIVSLERKTMRHKTSDAKKFLIYLHSIVLWWVKQATISVDIKNIQWVFLLLFDIYLKNCISIMNSWQTYWFLIKIVYDHKIIKKKHVICQNWRLNAQLEAHLYSMRDRFILCSLSNIRWQRRLIVIQIIELQG